MTCSACRNSGLEAQGVGKSEEMLKMFIRDFKYDPNLLCHTSGEFGSLSWVPRTKEPEWVRRVCVRVCMCMCMCVLVCTCICACVCVQTHVLNDIQNPGVI